MKRYLTVLTATFVLFVFGVSAVFASISIPPSDPNNNPPGPSVSYEQGRMAKICQEHYDNYVAKYCSPVGGPLTPYNSECRKRALKTLNECLQGVLNPPQLILPNGGSRAGQLIL